MATRDIIADQVQHTRASNDIFQNTKFSDANQQTGILCISARSAEKCAWYAVKSLSFPHTLRLDYERERGLTTVGTVIQNQIRRCKVYSKKLLNDVFGY